MTATEERSQHKNKARAIKRLRLAIALQVRSGIDPDNHAPSELLASCISGDGQLCVGRRDARYPAAVAELLDILIGCGMRVGEAATMVGVSTANLVKFIENDRLLWRRVNEMREAAGIKRLR